jgi:hypothetical protein
LVNVKLSCLVHVSDVVPTNITSFQVAPLINCTAITAPLTKLPITEAPIAGATGGGVKPHGTLKFKTTLPVFKLILICSLTVAVASVFVNV